ncbi:MAG: geranylgeranylglycerol-phosphate geranylgeranyltransferase [Methanomicrobiales archaeon]|nr:geranylgeranylglycerol-phosphate geranylgeranyltransferase [Methanomicrobiales archaeon]
MAIGPFLEITRPVNSLVAGLAAVLGYLIATGTVTAQALILLPIVAFITAAGNVLNDYYDAGIDRVNRPDRPIPSGRVSRENARIYALVLFLIGNALCLLTNVLCLIIAVANSLILVGYAWRLKKVPGSGNLAVAYLTGSIFLFGGAFVGWEGLVRNFTVFAITLLATLCRELWKAAEDVEGDRTGGARTIPVRLGVRTTGWLAFGFAVAAVGVSLLPTGHWSGSVYLGGILPVDGVILVSSALSLRCDSGECVKRNQTTSILKVAMFAALVVFTIAAIL